MLRRLTIRSLESNSSVRHYLSPWESVTKYRERGRIWVRIVREDGDMKRTLPDEELARAGTRDAEAHGVTRLDREALEGVMRDDVFRAADGKALGLYPSDLLPRGRRGTRRA